MAGRAGLCRRQETVDITVFPASPLPQCEGSTWPWWGSGVSPPLPVGNLTFSLESASRKESAPGSEPSCTLLLSSSLLPCCLAPPSPIGSKPFSLLFKRIYFIKHYF